VPDLLLKQAVPVIDRRTTMTCLHVAGQIRPVDEPFDTLAGPFEYPPFHAHCRTISAPYMSGFSNDVRAAANTEVMKRPLKQRRISENGYEGRLPPPPTPALVVPERTVAEKVAAVETRRARALKAAKTRVQKTKAARAAAKLAAARRKRQKDKKRLS
jgi:hypothetical protein